MKQSYYNLFSKHKGNKRVGFNTMQNAFCVIRENDFELLCTDIDKLQDVSPNVFEMLKTTGFIIEKDRDEFSDLQNEYQHAVENESTYELTLLPTLDCNLRCWYCFEKHIKDSHLTPETSKNILHFIQRILENENIQTLKVEMFGGEPLLFFENELYPLLAEMKKMVEAKEKRVEFSFVTNAMCIKREHIALFKTLQASFQISIDGNREQHNKVKFNPITNEGTYDEMIDIVHMLVKELDNTYINLRINYDDETLGTITELIEKIKDLDRHKIGIHLERVWQTGDAANYDNELLINAINQFLANSFTVSYMNLSRRSISCKASKKNQCVISYDGSIYKCTGRDFTNEMQEGHLDSNGEIVWDEKKVNKRMSICTYDNDMCRKCKLLPLCWGPCCQKQLESVNGELNGFCQIRNMEMKLSDYIKYRFNNQYVQSKVFEEVAESNN